MKKLIVPFILVMLLVGVIIGSTANADKQFGCFYGTVYIDGVPADHVDVNLTIGGEHYEIWTSGSSYDIGSYFDTGDFCLKAKKTTGQVIKMAAYQGHKSGAGSIHYDLYMTTGQKDCTPSK